MNTRTGRSAYEWLIALLEDGRARYRILDHIAEGRTEFVSAMRGHDPSKAAKCMVVMVKTGKKITRYVLAVVPGDMRVDLDAVKHALGGTYASFASREIAQRLSRAESGAIMPFPPSDELELVADPRLFRHDEIYFNAGRLDRSIALAAQDYLALARPRLERIAYEVSGRA